MHFLNLLIVDRQTFELVNVILASFLLLIVMMMMMMVMA
jgi:hypothetical protein